MEYWITSLGVRPWISLKYVGKYTRKIYRMKVAPSWQIIFIMKGTDVIMAFQGTGNCENTNKLLIKSKKSVKKTDLLGAINQNSKTLRKKKSAFRRSL